MNTQDNSNLDVNYLEVVTCTYEELCKIKKLVNGRLYHTSDTNEFYFDWNNRRHKLSVFKTENRVSSDEIITKTDLENWLKENDYITNISLADALVEVIGTPLENVITKQALENYSREYLLTKEELELLNEPLDFVRDIENLQNSDRTLYSYCERLAQNIAEVRAIANEKISSGEMNTILNDYVDKAFAESVYLSKEDAGEIYIDNEKFIRKLGEYVKSEELQQYLKKTDAAATYLTKNDAANNYVNRETLQQYPSKSEVSRTYVTKTELNSTFEKKEDVDTKLNDYVKKTDTTNFVKKSEAEAYAKKSDLSQYEKVFENNAKLNDFAKKIWVDTHYAKQTDLRKFVTNTSLNEKLNDYATKEEVESGYVKNSTIGQYQKKDEANATFATKTSLGNYYQKNVIDAKLEPLAKKNDVANTYATKAELAEKYDTSVSVDSKLNDYVKKSEANDYLTKNEAEDTYAKKTALSQYEKKSELNETLTAFAKKQWVDDNYVKPTTLNNYSTKSYLESKLNDYATKNLLNEKLSSYMTSDQIARKYIEKGSLPNYVDVQYLNEVLDVFAKKTWVDTHYMKRFKLSDYMTADTIDRYYLKKDDAEARYVTKTDADSTYARKDEIVSPDGNYATEDTLTAFAKKIWVDEWYMKKFEFEGFKNALVLSTEFPDYCSFESYYYTENPQQGFYFLKDEGDGGEMWVLINNNDLKAKANLTTGQMEVDTKIRWGGPAATEW